MQSNYQKVQETAGKKQSKNVEEQKALLRESTCVWHS